MPRRPNIPPKDFPRPATRDYAGSRADAARWARDVLRSQILDGVYGGLAAARPALPSESELAAEFGVSRNAIREALELLRGEGMITRVQGAGTFVTGAKLSQRLDRLEGLAESLAGHRLPVDNEVLSVRESIASPFVAAKLDLPENAPILFIERLRSVGGVPLSLDTTSLRIGAIPTDANLNRQDVFALIEKELTTPEEAKQYVESTGVDILAPAVGNAHGMLQTMVQGSVKKHLDLTRIREIKNAARSFLTLHGGSGTEDNDLRGAIAAG